MRALLLFAFALLLAACAPRGEERCDLMQSHAVTFTSDAESDIVEARSVGASCSAATAVLIVRAADGFPAWAWAAPFHPAFGGGFAPSAENSGPDREAMEAFLTRWAQASSSRTREAPAWNETLRTGLARDVYEDIRARNMPMLCHLTAVARETCVYWESGVASAGELYQREITTP